MTWGLWGHTAGRDVPDPVCAECGEPVMREGAEYPGWAHVNGDNGHEAESHQPDYWYANPGVDPVHHIPTDEAWEYRVSSPPDHDDWGDKGFSTEWLTEDVRQNGIKYPIEIVTDGTHAHVDNGHHRLAATRAAGLSHVPAYVTRLHGDDYPTDHLYDVPPGTRNSGHRRVGPTVQQIISGTHTASRTAAVPDMYHWDLDWSQAEQRTIPTAGLQWRQYPDYSKPTGRFNFKKMPPVKVLIHEGEPWIMDGHHRVDWAQQRGYEEVPALVMEHPSHTASRTAAVNQELVDGLHGEFSQWWDENQKDQPEWIDYTEGERGPIGFWPHVESFLKDRYPAAYRNKVFGHEQVADLLDVPDLVRGEPYETGPDVETQHGYDPKEIASAMLLLHNRSDPLRGDLAEEDQERLNDIFQKRQQMQRNYEQRTAAAASFRIVNEDDDWVAYHGDKPVGSLSVDYTTHTPSIDSVRVHPDYQRQGIARSLWEAAGRPAHTDDDMSEAGRAWARSVGGDRIGTASRTAMPWYHNTDAELNPGDELLPASQRGHESEWGSQSTNAETGQSTPLYPHYDPHSVYLYNEHGDPSDYEDFGQHRYEVEPIGQTRPDPERESNRQEALEELAEVHGVSLDEAKGLLHEDDIGGMHSYVVPRARIVRKLNTASRLAMPSLYRGLEHEFDPDRPATPIGAPDGYSHWTDNPEIARQWAGPEGHVYNYDLPEEAAGSKWINENPDGKTPLYFDNGPLMGRPGGPELKGREYLVYNDHDDYDPTQIKPYKEANLMTAAVTVYTKPDCPQCTMTKKQLDKLGIDHDTVDVTQDPDAHAYVSGLGYSSAPVVVVNDGESHWSGFRPDHLRGLVE